MTTRISQENTSRHLHWAAFSTRRGSGAFCASSPVRLMFSKCRLLSLFQLACQPHDSSISGDLGSGRTRRIVRGHTLIIYRPLISFFRGIYHKEYLDYLRNLLPLPPNYGISAFVLLHQDVWARYSEGSGAPTWTLEAVGFDLHASEEVGAA